MADIAAYTGWTFEQIREIDLAEEAAIRRAINRKLKNAEGAADGHV